MASYLRNFAIVVMALLLGGFFLGRCAHAIDRGQNTDPAIKEWFENLKQPENPVASCCGESDGYWCEQLHTRDGKNYCNITDDRVIPGRTLAPLGMEIEIPTGKMMDGHQSNGNPTGHSIVFLSSGLSYVYCFIMDSGI